MPYDDDVTTAGYPSPDAAPRGFQVSLVVYQAHGVDVVPLPAERPVTLGRSSSCALVLDETSVSRQHARFRLDRGQVWVDDLGSRNGTFVSGKRVTCTALVSAEDDVRLGAVSVGLHLLGPNERPQSNLVGHDRLLADLEDELSRARTFGRALGLITVRVAPGHQGNISRWYPRVQRLLRAFDRVAIYGAEEVEVLVPELPAEQVVQLAREICAQDRSTPLLCGVGVFPQAASSTEELLQVTRRACQQASLQSRVQVAVQRGLAAPPTSVAELSDAPEDDASPVVLSASMIQLHRTIRRVAASTIPVLIVGETGTGKEIVAREIWRHGARAAGPLLCLNCGAIPGQLIESALFGHERGAFTGAHSRAKGVFEEAHGGTVLLDEVGGLPPSAQAALLRVLESKRISRVGSSAEIDVDVRVLAATNRDLEQMCSDGRFRLDLLYRLNAMTLHVPPLRERPEEVEPLALRFVRQSNRDNGCQVTGISAQAQTLLARYNWPGNVRELRNVIERAVVLVQRGPIPADALSQRVRDHGARSEAAVPRGRKQRATVSLDVDAEQAIRAVRAAATPRSAPPPLPGLDLRGGLGQAMRGYERALILAALEQTAGNHAAAARLLALPLRTLFHKVKVLGLREGGDEPPALIQLARDAIRSGGRTYRELTNLHEEHILSAVWAETRADRSATARRLQLSPRVVNKKLKQVGLL